MRSRYGGLLVGLVAGAMIPGAVAATSVPAGASCVGPMLDVAPRGETFVRGATIEVGGHHFVDGCNDTGSCTGFLGCQRCDYGPPPAPRTAVELQLVQRGRAWDLGTADAAADGSVTWRVTFPADARRGAARLVADGAQPVRVRLR